MIPVNRLRQSRNPLKGMRIWLLLIGGMLLIALFLFTSVTRSTVFETHQSNTISASQLNYGKQGQGLNSSNSQFQRTKVQSIDLSLQTLSYLKTVIQQVLRLGIQQATQPTKKFSSSTRLAGTLRLLDINLRH